MSVDEETVFRARVAGKSVRKISRELGCSEGEVNQVLEQRSRGLLTEGALKVALMLENQRLDDILEALYPKAISGDPVAAGLMVKLGQRRSCLLLGLDAPIAQAVHVFHRTETPHMNSTQRIRAAPDAVKGITPEQRAQMDAEEEARPPNSEPPGDKRSPIGQTLDRLCGKAGKD